MVYNIVLRLFNEPFYVMVSIGILILTIAYLVLPISTIFYFSAMIYPIVSIAPFSVYLVFYKSIGLSWDDKLSVLLFFQAIASLAWTLGEIMWCYYYNLLLGTAVPYPSEADAFYVTGDLLAIIGQLLYLFYLYKVVGSPLRGRKKYYAYLVTTLLICLVTYALVYPVMYWYGEEGVSMVELVMDSTYLVLEIIMVSIALIGFLVIRGRLGKVFLIILISNLLYFSYTLGFSYLELMDLYYDGHPIELLDLFSSLLDACAIYEAYKLIVKSSNLVLSR